MAKMQKETAIGSPGNGGDAAIARQRPYIARAVLTGTVPIFFHRYDPDAVEEKGRAKKGSEERKVDNVESYVFRNDEGVICLPGYYVCAAMAHSARYRQDPRSPRKSASDLFKAGVLPLTDLAPLGKAKEWDYEDRRRVVVQRSAVTRHRPAFKAGWEATVELMVETPEYITPDFLHAVLSDAGRLSGLADYRPTFGRFRVTNFEILTDQD